MMDLAGFAGRNDEADPGSAERSHQVVVNGPRRPPAR